MKKKMLFIITLLTSLVMANVFAGKAEIPSWWVNGGGAYGTEIFVNNISDVSIDATITFWENDGSLLTNTTISSGQTTDSNGQISFTLLPRESNLIYISTSYFSSYKYGSGLIEVSPSNTNDKGVSTYHGTVYATGWGLIFGGDRFAGMDINGGNPF